MSKPRGHFKYVLAIDTETSGYNRENLNVVRPSRWAIDNGADPDLYYQILSAGLMVVELETLKVIEKLYVEIKWDGKSAWDAGAQRVHGLSKEYLEENALDEEVALSRMLELILKYWGPDGYIVFMGHNVPFDIQFLMDLSRRHGVDLNISGRFIDTNTIGMIVLGTFSSDELFEAVGLPPRSAHNSLEDIEYTVKAAKQVKRSWEYFCERFMEDG